MLGMRVPSCRTKIVCTIGPASSEPAILERLAEKGMSVARINFSHGDLDRHARVIEAVREAERRTARRITVMADLPGPKMRIGRIADEPVELVAGARFTLTTEDIVGDGRRVSVSFPELPRVVKPGDTLFINDGLVQLAVDRVEGAEVRCTVVVGGELRSRKGLNLPGVSLGIDPLTPTDRTCLGFCAAKGVDAVCMSFVSRAEDVTRLRGEAAGMGYHPFVVAKIERACALDDLEGIVRASDGVMVARGDLGVEVPIERMAVVQKQIIHQAVVLGKPVITATQMLESMTSSPRPTRAEATDVANAVLDGTDCVMLSGESAMGRYPVEAAEMLARIAGATEPFGPGYRLRDRLRQAREGQATAVSQVIAMSIDEAIRHTRPAAIFVPTASGDTARDIARFRPPVWIVAVCTSERVCRTLAFTSGVLPVLEPEPPSDWKAYCRAWLDRHGLEGDVAILAAGPSPANPGASHRMEIIDVSKP